MFHGVILLIQKITLAQFFETRTTTDYEKKTSLLILLRATAVPAGTAEARSYGNSVCPSVCLSRPGGIPSPDEIEAPGLHHMIARSL